MTAAALSKGNVMKATKYIGVALALVVLFGVRAAADVNDAWLTTKAKIALLTADGLTSRGINVDTVNGAITLHGKVPTQVEKDKAASSVREVEGVKSVNNLLQVVPESARKQVAATDAIIKDRTQAALRAEKSFNSIRVASVNNGVVLLSGKAATLTEKLRAIELVANVDGVARVASEIQTGSN